MIQEHIVDNLFGHYHIISQLAEYPSHTVYLATKDAQATQTPRADLSQSSEELVTIKVWHSIQSQELFLEHAYLLSTLTHPHIVKVLDAGIEQGLPYIVSNFASRGSLRKRLQQQAPYPLSISEALTIVTGIGQAIAYAHQQDLLHGAIKPENILFNEHNEALLADFRGSSTSACVPYSDIFTYMPPEQFAGHTTRKSDQYALACVAYELLTGYVPFAGTDAAEIQQQFTEPLLPPRQLQPTIPTHIEQALLRALSLRAEYRFPSIDKFIMALHTASHSSLHSSITIAKDTSQDNPAPIRPLIPRPMPLADVEATQDIPAPPVPATPLVLPDPFYAAPVEAQASFPLSVIQDGATRAHSYKRKKGIIWGIACVTCVVVLVMAGVLSLLKTHTSSTPQPNDGVINIAVNTQPGKHTAPATPPRIQHFVVTPTTVPTHGSTPKAVPVALFNATHLPPPGTIDLTNEGQLDWVQWGMNGIGSVNHKAGVSSQIGTYSVVGDGSLKSFWHSPTSYTWSDGTPNGNASGTNTGIGIVGAGNGFQLTIPAATTAHTLRIYVGVFHAQATFTAALSQKSSMIYSDTPQSNSGGITNTMYIVKFAATSTTQQLAINLILHHAYNGGMVTLQAATLQ